MPATFAAAVTTAPRQVDYLPKTLKSLAEAGFADPLIVDDWPRLGIVPNFRRALHLLLEIGGIPLIFQDDVTVACGLHDWLKSNPPPHGVSMLYVAAERDWPDGWNRLPLTPEYPLNIGGCGICMDNETARRFLDAPPPLRTDRLGSQLAQWCFREGIDFYLHSPSLVQHQGEVSVRGRMPIRRAGRFCGDAAMLGNRRELEKAVPHCPDRGAPSAVR